MLLQRHQKEVDMSKKFDIGDSVKLTQQYINTVHHGELPENIPSSGQVRDISTHRTFDQFGRQISQPVDIIRYSEELGSKSHYVNEKWLEYLQAEQEV